MRAILISRADGSHYNIPVKGASIGSEGCDINILAPYIEKTHAVINFDEGDQVFVISDLNTAHGIYVNESRVQNAAVKLANGDILRMGFNGPLFDVKILDGVAYPPVPIRSQAWNTTATTHSAVNQSIQESTHLPYLPVPQLQAGQPPVDSSSAKLPYPPPMPPGQVYLDLKTPNPDGVTPHPPLQARPSGGVPTQRARPLSAGGLSSSGRWISSKSMQELSAEERACEMEQKLLKMGDEISRLASYEAECYRKDGVIISLRNEIAELRTLLSEKEGIILRNGVDRAYGLETMYSQRDSDAFKSVMREKDDFEKRSAHKMALLQEQLHQKNAEIRDLEARLHDVISGKWPKGDPEATTNTIASLKSTIAKKDLKIAHIQTDLEKSGKQRGQSASLINTLQREMSTKEAMMQKSKNEADRLRRENKEKDSQISSLSAKIAKQKASKEVEKDFRKKEEEIGTFRQKLLTADHQIKEKLSVIRDMENEIGNLRRIMDEYKQNDINMQKDLQNMRIQYVEKERADKSNRVELKEIQIKTDNFKNSLLQSLYASGLVKESGELNEKDIRHYVEELINERGALQRRADEFFGCEKERKNFAKEDEHCKQVLEKLFTSMEKRFIRNGRLCEVLDEEIGHIHSFEATENMQWIKDLMTNILQQERNWEDGIEGALLDAGLEVDRGKREPALLIRKLNERVKKKKEKVADLKARVKAVESEHQESLTNFKKKFLFETEEEVTKAVEKLKMEEEKRVQNLKNEFFKREKEKITEAVEAERKIFEREFGNLTELHKQLGQTQLTMDQHKNKSVTLQDQILQLKFAMEKAQQNENELRKEIEERDTNHKLQLESVSKEKEELKDKFIDELNIYREQARQYSLTIVALEEKLLKMNRTKKKVDDGMMFARQYKDSFSMSGRMSPPRSPRRMVSRPTSPRKVRKHDVSVLTDLSFWEDDRRRQEEVRRLEQHVAVLRKEASDARRKADEQNDVVRGLRRDLAGASAKLSDITGELDDSQKERVEDLQTQLSKKDTELLAQRKQLVELSSLVERQKEELLKRDDKFKEQLYVAKVQERRLEEKGKEIVEMIKTQENIKGEEEAEKFEVEKRAYASKEVTAAGARCLGDKHDQTIARQKEALAEMRGKVRDLEVFKPPFPSQQAALQQVSLMKRELTELRTELSLRERDMYKDETELQTETRLSRELLNSANQELAVEKMAHSEARDALDASEQTYLDLMRAVCSLLNMQVPKRLGTITNMAQNERENVIKDRAKIMDEIITRLDSLHKRLSRKEKLLGGYERDLTQLRDTEDLAGRKSAEAVSLSNSMQSKQNEIDCLREALKRTRDELDQQKRLNKSLSQKKIFKMDFDKQLEKERKGHHFYESDEQRYKEEMKRQKQAEKMKRKNYEIESLKKELRSADLELSETAAKLHEFQTSEILSSPRKDREENLQPALEELWKNS